MSSLLLARAARLAGSAALTTIVLALGAGPALADGTVVPTVDCSVNNGDGTYTASFGYLNTMATSLNLDVGDNNLFTPGNPFQGQPTTFDVGSYPAVTRVSFDPAITPTVSWVLDGAVASASASTPLCVAAATGIAGSLSPTAATLSALIDPRGQTTTYHFDYGTTTAYGSSTPAQSAAGADPSLAGASLTGLTPGVTYHYRVQASNAAVGTTLGQDATFTTPAPPTTGAADLNLAVREAPASARRGHALAYRLTITNRGPSAATAIVLTDLLPSGVSVTALHGDGATCASHEGLTCRLAELPSGAAATVTLTLVAHRRGSLRQVAYAFAQQPDPTPTDNIASVITRVGS